MREPHTFCAAVGLSPLLFAGVAGIALVGPAAHGASYSFEAVDTGWYLQNGFHDPSNGNYIVGDGDTPNSVYHDFFVFNLAGLALGPNEQVATATFTVATHDVSTDNPSETVTFFDVSTPIATLVAGTGGTSAYADLGSGTAYGS